MREKKNIQKAESIVVSPADFVLSWKDVSMFSQNYTLDRNVIGEGKFFLKTGWTRFRGVWCCSQVYTQVDQRDESCQDNWKG